LILRVDTKHYLDFSKTLYVPNLFSNLVMLSKTLLILVMNVSIC